MSKALLLVAHGSRREASNEEVFALAESLADISGFDCVEVAFLEFARPAIADALATLQAQGSTDVVVLPYFLAAGKHVQTDVPDAIERYCSAHPTMSVNILPHIGSAAGMVGLLHAHSDSQLSPNSERLSPLLSG